jgi:tripartite-type tricarboxylate transporter receptor subunit TctC
VTKPNESQTQAWRDPISRWLEEKGYPVTRENWLAMAYPDGEPEPWTAELEATLPEELQDQEELKEKE